MYGDNAPDFGAASDGMLRYLSFFLNAIILCGSVFSFL